MASERPVQIAICERHGLKYNAATETGCVRCRRESEPPPTTSPSAPRAASAPLQIVVALLLVSGAGALFCAAQSAMLAGYPLLRHMTERGAEPAAPSAATDALSAVAHVPAAPTDADGATGDAAAEQQQRQELEQMHRLLQQVQGQGTDQGATPRATAADEPH